MSKLRKGADKGNIQRRIREIPMLDIPAGLIGLVMAFVVFIIIKNNEPPKAG